MVARIHPSNQNMNDSHLFKVIFYEWFIICKLFSYVSQSCLVIKSVKYFFFITPCQINGKLRIKLLQTQTSKNSRREEKGRKCLLYMLIINALMLIFTDAIGQLYLRTYPVYYD